eukprot:TRINITY_DN424_c0_g1_i1.p3 TRINITY_DN424_c0_g1~~TRINITY_DN424_c0_g1_i1.p3  ORF type:complete len:112 (-),score=30.07 TRINITY_DN424_c0_g1_i1:220-555(-)
MALKMSLAATPFCPGVSEWHSSRQATRMTPEEEMWLEAQMAAAAKSTSARTAVAQGVTTASSVSAGVSRMQLGDRPSRAAPSSGATHGLTQEEQDEFDRWISGAVGGHKHA